MATSSSNTAISHRETLDSKIQIRRAAMNFRNDDSSGLYVPASAGYRDLSSRALRGSFHSGLLCFQMSLSLGAEVECGERAYWPGTRVRLTAALSSQSLREHQRPSRLGGSFQR